jgi:hypothetical protein
LRVIAMREISDIVQRAGVDMREKVSSAVVHTRWQVVVASLNKRTCIQTTANGLLPFIL